MKKIIWNGPGNFKTGSKLYAPGAEIEVADDFMDKQPAAVAANISDAGEGEAPKKKRGRPKKEKEPEPVADAPVDNDFVPAENEAEAETE